MNRNRFYSYVLNFFFALILLISKKKKFNLIGIYFQLLSLIQLEIIVLLYLLYVLFLKAVFTYN